MKVLVTGSLFKVDDADIQKRLIQERKEFDNGYGFIRKHSPGIDIVN